MEVSKQIEVFRGFFEKECLPEIMAAFQAGIPFITIDFNALSEADLELSELLLEGPDEIIKAAEIAMEHFDIPKSINSFKVRFIHLPKGSSKNVWEVRQDDIGKFIALKGVISKFSEVIHTCISARFECINCGKTVGMLMTDGKYKEPRKCSCGGKRFRRIQMQIEDVLKIGITDDLMEEDNKSRTVARTKIAILGGSLSSRELESLIATGRKVIMNGYFIYRQKSATVEFESVFVVNSMEFVEVGWQSVNILPHEAKQIEQLAKQHGIIARLAESVADIKGYDEVKKACLLQLAGAPHIYDRNGVLASRGTMHILLIGNPSTGKTYIAKRFGRISPIYSFQSASTASGKGLVAAVQNDPDLGCAALYPGVVAMANQGVVCIDEIDKTHTEDYGDHNNAMEDMEVFIAKSNIKARLETKTSYLATANPESRIFIPEVPYYKQISMPLDFQDRFDVIFPLFSPFDKDKIDSIMDVMLDRHLGDEDKNAWKPEFDHEFIRKYIAYCIQKNPRPKMSRELFPFMKQKVHELMNPRGEEQEKITFRNINNINRFAYASARLRLRDVTKEDLELAFELKRKSFIDLKVIDETGAYNWGVVEGVDMSKPSLTEIVHTLKKIIRRLGQDFVDGIIPIETLTAEAEKENISEDDVEEILEKLRKNGDIFEPKAGFVKEI